MRNNRILIFIAMVLVSITMLFQFATSITVREASAQDARLRYAITPDNVITALKGQWEVFPDLLGSQLPEQTSSKMATIEDLWPRNEQHYTFGVVSHRLTVTGLDPYIHYGVYVQDEASAYQLRINGEPVLRNGTPSSNPSIYVSDVKVQMATFQADENGTAVFVMTIANYERGVGGFWHPVIIGNVQPVTNYYMRIAAIEIFMLAIMIAMGLFFFLQSSIEESHRSLTMAVFCFMVAFRIGSTGIHLIHELLPGLSMMTVTRLDYMSGYLLLPSIGLLVEQLNFTKPLKGIRRALVLLAILSVGFTSLVPDHWLEMSYEWYRALVGLYTIYGIYVIGMGLKNKVEGAVVVSIAVSFLIIGAILEYGFPDVPYGLYFCSMIFVLMMGISVMIRFASINTRKEHLESAVLTDALTQVGNRAGLLKELDLAKPVALGSTRYLLFVDVNNFKHINDQYGHKVGDGVLIETTNRFKKSTRLSDRIFRYGGDEFVILTELSNSYPIDSFIDRIRKQFEEPFLIEDQTLTITLAIGYEAYNPNQSADEVIRLSDLKMYEDKRNSEKKSSR